MKNLLFFASLIFVLSSCSMSIHNIKKGTLDVPKKESYTVVYKIKFSEGLKAKVEYTAGNHEQEKLKSVTGLWEKTVVLASGSPVEIRTLATGAKGRAEYQVTVDGKLISEYTLSGKRLNYSLGFDLP